VKIVWSPLAIERAYEEAQFIAEDKPEAAVRWLEKLFESTDRLEMFPKSGSMVPEIALPDYRQIVYRSHRVIYRVEKTQVSILTVRSSSQLLRAADIVQ
jgi:plasmid stabilization system protein ParE